MNRAVLLVLANLALMGCGKKAGPGNVPNEQRKDCASDKDCDATNPWCMTSGDASTGKCYPPPREGRPLTIAGEVHVASLAPAPAAGRPGSVEPTLDVTLLRSRAQDEHASIAAFARTIAELMALGAPLSLLAETQRALEDEIRHTERTLDAIEAFTGDRPTFAPLAAAVAPLARSIAAFFRDVLVGGAIGETLAAAAAQSRLTEASTEASTGSPPDLDEMIVVDESRHAALAFKTLRWLLEKKPELRSIVDEERGKLDPSTHSLLAPLFDTVLED